MGLNFSRKELKELDKYVKKTLGNEYDLDMLGIIFKESGFPWALIFVYLYQTETYCDACQVIMNHFMEAFK